MVNPVSQINHLVISAIGEDRPGIVNELSKLCREYQCNIIDSRMTVLGGEFAVIMMISGNWDSVAKLESAIPTIARKLDLTTMVKQTKARLPAKSITYSINVVALDQPGIVHDISQFFSRRNINIADLETNTYSAPHCGTQMFNLNMTIHIPSETHLASLREEFMLFCDDRNLDAVIEPVRNL
ncbi:glycine cleavage system protein R [Hahella ganghwensis]|uniref:glycine cleavage system protein R n=1 Tax=Hahella ganghwensis TaxID=286420 RepID=UPI00036DE8AF|nr:glycine cleavage system protein R [Hahella ganghwensis]